MAKTKKRKRRIFLETSGVIYELHGERRMRAAVLQATRDGRIEVSNFIRMEYLRLVILNLIDFYFLIKESESLADALIEWSQKFQIRKVKIVMMSACNWLVDQEDSQAKEKSLRRLGEGIVRLVYRFDELLSRRAKGHLKCELGKVYFPRRPFDEDMLLDFYKRFRAIQKRIPTCALCEFKERKRRWLTQRRIDLYSPAQREKYQSNKGYVAQAERLEQAANANERVPKCRWCERVGDGVIALQVPEKAVLVTADQAFLAFGEILGREDRVRLLPSLTEIKKRQSGGGQSTDSGKGTL